MPELVLFSFSPGATPEEHMALLRGGRQPDAEPAAPEPETGPEPLNDAAPEPKAKRRRAKDPEGRFVGDDPTTPQDEAWA